MTRANGITRLVWACTIATLAMVYALAEEAREVDRLVRLGPEHFRKRNDEKNAAGFKARELI